MRFEMSFKGISQRWKGNCNTLSPYSEEWKEDGN